MRNDATEIDILKLAGLSESRARALLGNLGPQGLAMVTEGELLAVGVGAATARRVAACVALGRRANAPVRRETLGRAEDAARLIAPRVQHLSVEVFLVLPIDIRNSLIGATDQDPGAGIIEVARGTVCGVEVHPREVFRPAVRVAAAGLVVAHNHPSGDPTPSLPSACARRVNSSGSRSSITS